MVCLKEWRFRGLRAMKRTLPQLREHRRSGVTRNEANKQQAHMKKLLFIGLDVHAKSITIGLAEGARKDFVQLQGIRFRVRRTGNGQNGDGRRGVRGSGLPRSIRSPFPG